MPVLMPVGMVIAAASCSSCSTAMAALGQVPFISVYYRHVLLHECAGNIGL